MHIVAIIPARMNSQRLPGKMLLPLNGTPLFERTYNQVRALFDQCYIATDAEEIIAHCEAKSIPYCRTGSHHLNGTTRCLEAYQRLGLQADFIVNVQGDEAFMEPAVLQPLHELLHRQAGVEAATLCAPVDEKAPTASNVFVVRAINGEALYFSRHPIPANRDGEPQERWQHIGVYAFTPKALEEYTQMRPTPLETAEKLEQLRWMEHGRRWHVAEAPFKPLSIDTAEDYSAAQRQANRAQ